MERKYSSELFDSLNPEKKRKVLDGIIGELAASGIDGCSVRTIANKIGISHGSLFHYFASKDAMVHFIIQEGVKVQREIMEMSAPPDGDFFCGLENLFGSALHYARTHREIISIWMSLSQPGQARYARHTLEMEKEAIKALKSQVRAARDSGAVSPEADIDAAAYMIDSLLANIIKSAVSEIEAMKFAEHFGPDDGNVIGRIMKMIRAFLAAPGE